MLKVLINSYACCPGMGSEPGMGWNWIVHLAKNCELYVISEGEFQEQCEEASKELPIHWYWNPVPQSTRKKCWNQGNWSFYPLYERWQKKTADIAREICCTENIDILHQLNMIGFREPGYLWKVSKETGVPFVWGPIGGMKQFPLAYADGGGLKMKIFTSLKNVINILQIRYHGRVKSALNHASVLISSIPDSYIAIKKYHRLESSVIPETGCVCSGESIIREENTQSPKFTILWVGKFDFRKRLDIALKTIATVANPNVMLKIFGTGNEMQIQEAKSLVKNLGIEDKVLFMGNCTNDVVRNEMLKADLFFFSSVNEDTSTVVLEAISNALPVLCFDACGMAAVVDSTVGRKIPLTNPTQSVQDFASQIMYLYDHPEELRSMSANCVAKACDLSWDNKAKQVMELYNKCVRAN